jgi:hypothetical protein
MEKGFCIDGPEEEKEEQEKEVRYHQFSTWRIPFLTRSLGACSLLFLQLEDKISYCI